MVLILIAAALVSFAIEPSDIADPVVILFVIFLNAALGLFQESKAEKALNPQSWRSPGQGRPGRRAAHSGGERTGAGDIILVEAGDFIPADARILECHNLKVEESLLTGESVPVEGRGGNTFRRRGSRRPQNMLFSTGIVTYGPRARWWWRRA